MNRGVNIRSRPQLCALAKALHKDPYYKDHILEVFKSRVDMIYRIPPDNAIAFYKNQDLKYLGHSLNLSHETRALLSKAENGISSDTRPIAADLIKALHSDPLLKDLIPNILKNPDFFTRFTVDNLPSFRRLSLEQSTHFIRESGLAQIIKKLGLNQEQSDILIKKALFSNPYAHEQAIRLLERINANPTLKPQMLDIMKDGSFNKLLTMDAVLAYGFIEDTNFGRLSQTLNLGEAQTKAVIAAGNRFEIMSIARTKLFKFIEALGKNTELKAKVIEVVNDQPMLAKLLSMTTEQAIAEVAELETLGNEIANLRGSGIRDFDFDTMQEVCKGQTVEMRRRIIAFTRSVAQVQKFVDGKIQLVASPEATALSAETNMGKLQVAKMNKNKNFTLNGLDRFLKNYGF